MVNMIMKVKRYIVIAITLSGIVVSVMASTAFIMIMAKPVSAELANAQLIDRIVAVVNNDVITLVELNSALQPYLVKLESSGYGSEKKKEMLSQLTEDMLNRMVERKITDQEAKRVKITVSDKEVDAAIERLKESQLMSQEDLEKALKADGLSFPDYREKIREEILRPKLINQSIKSKVIITDSDIKDYYEKNNQGFAGKKRYYLRNILIRSGEATEETGSNNVARNKPDMTKEEIKKRAHQINARLDAGEDFKAVAKTESEAPNAAEGGDLGFFDWDTLSDTIKEAVEPLKVGRHTDVISTDQGYQIFYVENIDNQNLAPLNEVSEAISKKLYDDIVEKKFREWLDALKKKSHIKIML